MDQADTPEPLPRFDGLTPEFLSQHFPIVRGIRRENRDLFEPWIAGDALKDDAKFYAILIRIIEEAPSVIVEFDKRMMDKRDKRKTFAWRADQFVRRSLDLGEEEEGDSLLDLPDDHFSPGSEEGAVHRLMWRLFREASGEATTQDAETDPADQIQSEAGRETQPELAIAAEAPLDWQGLARELAAMCSVLEMPEPDQAEAIAEKAQLLLAACRQAAKEKAAARTKWYEALVYRLSELGLARLPGTDGGGVSDDALGTLERRVSDAENARRVWVAAEEQYRALRQQQEAVEAENYEGLEALLPRLKAARGAVRAAKATFDDVLADCERMVSKSGPTPIAPPVTPDPVSEQQEHVPKNRKDRTVDAPETAVSASAGNLPEDRESSRGAASGSSEQLGAIEPDRVVSSPREEKIPEAVTEGPPAPLPVPVAGLDDLLMQYLSRNEWAFAYHLAALAEERGEIPAVPSALLRALVRGSRFARPEDVADGRNQSLLAEAMAALATVEQEDDDQRTARARAIALAALLRPALFDFNRTARAHLEQVSLVNGLQAYAQLATGLAGLGFDVQLSIEDLAELHGRERQRKTPAALEELRQWYETSRKARTAHQPTYRILHQLLAPEGEIGSVVEAALRKEADASGRARNLVTRLADSERFVADTEGRLGRPKRDRIEGLALSWITSRLDEGRAMFEAWLAACSADSGIADDRRRETLRRHVGAITKACDEVRGSDERGGQGLSAAVFAVLDRAVGDFASLMRGELENRVGESGSDPVRVALLRLPALCLPLSGDGDAFDKERKQQRDCLFEHLCRPETIARDLQSAFEARIAEDGALAATEVLVQLERSDSADEALPKMRQALDETMHAAREKARTRVQRLRQDLAILLNLDPSAGGEVGLRLDQFDEILSALSEQGGEGPRIPALDGVRSPDVPPDFPHLEVLLAECDRFRDDLRKHIREDQLGRLGRLTRASERPDVARELTSRAPGLDPVTLDDMIADLEAGRDPLATDEGEADLFGAFFPDFVETLARKSDLTLNRILAAASEGRLIDPLDFGSLDKTAADRAKALIENWGQASEALRARRQDRLQAAVERLLGLIGFTGLKVESDRVLDQGRLHGLRFACDAPKPGLWFLSPELGSLAGGHYRILVASAAVDPVQVATAVGDAPDSPWIVLHFGRLDRKAREALARAMRQDRRAAVMLDEALLLHLAAAGGDPLERLFTCASPFALLQPYTTNPRNIPPEMFFGRREEMARITALGSSGSLIYGGRQLGKSALLNQIRRNLHQPRQGRLALYLDIVDVGDVPMPTSAIWSRIANALEQDREVVPERADATNVVAAIRAWLNRSPERRILLMLDEADHFLAGEHPSYPNLRPLKDLMEATGWRFKVVFAGLHNVRRLAQAPNSPLVHLGEPVCVGPMNTTAENRRELRRLATQPMQVAGFVYDPPALAADILARVNHYPSLVQVFCKEAVAAAGSRLRVLGPGPRWKLDRETLFEGGLAARTAAEIRKRFQWTLDLDPRYDLIAKCLALYRLDHQDGHAAVLRQGLTAEEIYQLVELWRPTSVERDSLGDFRALLDEMVDLGVLGSKDHGRYGLRNAQVAQLMGHRDAIYDEVLALNEKEPKADYDAASYHRRSVPEDPDSISPLSDRQLADLFAGEAGGIRIVVAAPELWGTDVGARLAALADAWEQRDNSRLQVLHHRGKLAGLRQRLEASRRSPLIIVLDEAWNRQTFDWLSQHASVRDGRVRVVWCLTPDDARRVLAHAPGVPTLRAPMLGDNMVRHWLRGLGLAKLDDRKTRGAILASSGGVPARLVALRPLLDELGSENPERRVERLGEWARKHTLAAESLALDPGVIEVFREVVQLVDDPDAPELKTEWRTVVELVPRAEQCLPSLAESGLVELFSDGRLRLTYLGKLIAA